MDNEKNQLIERIVGLRIKTNKAELGIHSLLRLWGFKGERPRLEPVPHYNSFNNKTDVLKIIKKNARKRYKV